MADLLQALLLGVVQGITEWLPVSSSGHLVIAQQVFGINVPLLFDIALHVGTLLAVVLFFHDEVKKLLGSLLKLDFRSEYGRLLFFIILASIPTALIGFAFHDLFESFFSSLLAVGIALVITGFILFISEKKSGNREITFLDSLLIGISQGITIIPGISRSGITISTGLLRGIDRTKAAKFSFLLSIPAIIGAALLEYNWTGFTGVDTAALLVGTASAFVSGYFSIKFLLNLIVRKKFHDFAYYCWLLGFIVVVLALR